jgi:twinkle protein
MRVVGYISGVKYTEEIIDKNGKQQCPVCVLAGKSQKRDTSLSVNTHQQNFKCHRCGWSGYYGQETNFKMEPKPSYERPDIGNQTELKDHILQHFSKRLISQKTLIRNKIKSAKGDWFAFTYFDGETPVKIKFKTPAKKMMQSKNSKPWIYKYNDLVGEKEVMICEGEEEALIWEEAGFNSACSVDMGAPNENDRNVDAKLQCITNCFDVFEKADTVFIAVDNDVNGIRLEKELIRRFGSEKCKIIDFKDKKDANDYAFKYGFDGLRKLKENAKDVKVDGIFELDDFREAIIHDYLNGQPIGTSTYINDIDPHWKWRLGEVNIWTGYNNEGKSLLLKQMQILKSIGDGWKHAIFSPEEVPLNEWYTDIIESYIGKSADKTQASRNNYMTKIELEDGMEFINKYFFNILPEKDHTLKSLLDKFSYCVRKHNVKTVTFDPYNQIHHLIKTGEREDLYISRFMAELKRFAVDHGVSMNLVAHQVTPAFIKDEDYPEPNIYKIKGGGTFGDKADNVLAVWREHRNTSKYDTAVSFISQKIKKQKLTGIPGRADLDYNRSENRYHDSLGNSLIGMIKQNTDPKCAEIGFFDNLQPNSTFNEF